MSVAFLKMFKAKLKAAGIHTLATLLVAILTSLTVFGLWYPREFASMLDGTDLLLLVMGVELAMGPLMSLVIFSPRKRKGELVRDYMLVGIVQLSALLYGLYVVALSRPVYLVFVKDRIEVVVAAELSEQDLYEGPEVFNRLPWLGPRLVCTESPTNPQEKSDLLLSALDGKDIQLLPKYYRYCHKGEIGGKAFAGEQLEPLIDAGLYTLPPELRENNFTWLPAVTRFGVWTIAFPEGEVEKAVYLELDPFLSQRAGTGS